MLSIYLIIIASGLAAAGLSFLTWLILLLSLGSNTITANVIAAIGFTYFLLHFLVLTLLRLNLKGLLLTRHVFSGTASSPAASWGQAAGNILDALKRSPVLRKAAWGILAGAALALLWARHSTEDSSRQD